MKGVAADTATEAVKTVYTYGGPILVVTTPDWTLAVPYTSVKSVNAGIFVAGTDIYTFKAPRVKVCSAVYALYG